MNALQDANRAGELLFEKAVELEPEFGIDACCDITVEDFARYAVAYHTQAERSKRDLARRFARGDA